MNRGYCRSPGAGNEAIIQYIGCHLRRSDTDRRRPADDQSGTGPAQKQASDL